MFEGRMSGRIRVHEEGDWAAVSFRIVEAQGTSSPVIVEVPHAGVAISPECMPWMIAPVRSVGRDADLYVDELFASAPTVGATLIVGELSRYVCDLNRSAEEIDSESVDGASGVDAPHGLIWHQTTDGHRALTGAVPQVELRRRLEDYYYPYHRALRRLLELRRQQFGFAILLCAHSMPSRGRHGSADVGRRRADLVPGTRGRTTAAPAVIRVIEQVASEFGWSISHDNPYRGGFTTVHYGQPKQGWHAIQVELSRARYMDENSLRHNGGFETTQALCMCLVRTLSAIQPTDL